MSRYKIHEPRITERLDRNLIIGEGGCAFQKGLGAATATLKTDCRRIDSRVHGSSAGRISADIAGYSDAIADLPSLELLLLLSSSPILR